MAAFFLGAGFAVYWPTSQALVQEIASKEELIHANSVLLMGVQSGMLLAGGFVGFLYERIGLAGVMSVDTGTYVASMLCIYGLRSGKHPPRPAGSRALDTGGSVARFAREIREGFEFLRAQPTLLALGLTYALLMAGVVSGNVVVVALVKDVFQGTAVGFGLVEAGWGVGALAGGLLTGLDCKAEGRERAGFVGAGGPGRRARACPPRRLPAAGGRGAHSFRILPGDGGHLDQIRHYDVRAPQIAGTDEQHLLTFQYGIADDDVADDGRVGGAVLARVGLRAARSDVLGRVDQHAASDVTFLTNTPRGPPGSPECGVAKRGDNLGNCVAKYAKSP